MMCDIFCKDTFFQYIASSCLFSFSTRRHEDTKI